MEEMKKKKRNSVIFLGDPDRSTKNSTMRKISFIN